MHPLRRRSGPRSVRPWWRAPVVAAGALGLVVALVVVNVDRTSVRVVRSTRSDVSVSMTVPDASTASTVPMPDVVPPVASTVTVPPVTPPPVTSPPVSSPPVSSPPVTSPPVTSPADPEAAFADPNLFVALLPQLSSEPAPTWVNQGTRLTYVASAASVPGAYHQYVEDENGGWVDPATGDRYRQEDIPAAVGHGYNQVTVTELNDALAVLSIRTYGFIGLDSANPVTTLTWGGSVGIPGAGADYWLHPDALTGVVETVSSGLKVVRMPYVIDGTAYRSIWVQLIGDDGNFTWVYDEDSGVLLHTSSSTTGPPITGPVAEGEGRDGSTFLTQSTLVGVRQIDLPWIDESAPPWVATIDHFEYAGEVTVSVGGSPSVVLDASLSVDRLESATDWARYRFARTIWTDVAPSVTEYVERVDGPAQVAALWVPPDGLAALSVGQVLDDDPLTRAVVSVAAIEPIDDESYVTIVEQGPAEESELVYEMSSGLLVSSTSTDLHLGTSVTFDLVDWS